MPDVIHEIKGIRILECASEGEPIRSARDATEIIGAARQANASFAVIPVARLGRDFFQLRKGIAGEIMQKFVSYGVTLAVVGDISVYLEESSALRNLVYECNLGAHVWFLPDLQSLLDRIMREGQRG